MHGLELFAGSRSIGKQAEFFGHSVLSCDNVQYGGIGQVENVLDFDYQKAGNWFDWIWASPPCTGFSVAAIGHHWTGGKGAYIPNTDTARLGIELLNKTLEIVDYYSKINPKLIFFIENPRGLMRKMPQMFSRNMIRHTVTYCQYGDKRMKPTDIWTNNKAWNPKFMCKNGASCHEAAPRGSRTGTQGIKNAHLRSVIPPELCFEIIKSIQPQIEVKNHAF